jgi:hypothetical protein
MNLQVGSHSMYYGMVLHIDTYLQVRSLSLFPALSLSPQTHSAPHPRSKKINFLESGGRERGAEANSLTK